MEWARNANPSLHADYSQQLNALTTWAKSEVDSLMRASISPTLREQQSCDKYLTAAKQSKAYQHVRQDMDECYISYDKRNDNAIERAALDDEKNGAIK